jgi:hypothetical protein
MLSFGRALYGRIARLDIFRALAGAIQSGRKIRQAKRGRKIYALTFKRVKSEDRRPVAIQTAFPLALPFQKTEPPSGLPRRSAPRF